MVQHRRLRRTEERLLLLCSPGLNITMCHLPAGSNRESAQDGFLRCHGRFSEFYTSKSRQPCVQKFSATPKEFEFAQGFRLKATWCSDENQVSVFR